VGLSRLPERGYLIYRPRISFSEWHFRTFRNDSRLESSLYSNSLILDIYFLQRNPVQRAAALALRDAILRLRRDGAFVAVPLFRVNTEPIGPHPAGKPVLHVMQCGGIFNLPLILLLQRCMSVHKGSYEIWVPSESFVSVYSYLCQHRGDLRSHSLSCARRSFPYSQVGSFAFDISILIHPLTREEVSARCTNQNPPTH
jgi:aromatic ring-cleaving dioxygenase